MTNPNGTPPVPDAFLSHSSVDKSTFVRPLAECLAEQGAAIWYDEYSMKPGDSLSTSIDEGLSRARCGLVVISPGFIKTARDSGWTRYEFRGIVSNSIGPDGRRIVPIWLDVTLDIVRDFSPSLADLLAIDATGKEIDQVALDVLRVIAPDRAGGLGRQRMLMATEPGRTTYMRLSELTPSPPLNRRVGGHVPLRALLVTQTLADCGSPAGSDYDAFLENLARDLHHEKELRVWEAIACSYSVACAKFDLDLAQKQALFRILLMATLGRADRSAIETVTPQVAGPVIEHFQQCMNLARGEAVIGPGGMLGLVKAEQSEARGTSEDEEPGKS